MLNKPTFPEKGSMKGLSIVMVKFRLAENRYVPGGASRLRRHRDVASNFACTKSIPNPSESSVTMITIHHAIGWQTPGVADTYVCAMIVSLSL